MSFWLRELAGWTLMVISLGMFALLYVFCERRMILEIWPWTIASIFVFRGSIHLLKVAVAARVALRVQDRLYPIPTPESLNQGALPGRIGPGASSNMVAPINKPLGR
jgi:hypothetical protein